MNIRSLRVGHNKVAHYAIDAKGNVHVLTQIGKVQKTSSCANGRNWWNFLYRRRQDAIEAMILRYLIDKAYDQTNGEPADNREATA